MTTSAGYRLVNYRGEDYSDGTPKLITLRIEQAMGKLEAALGYPAGSLDLPQGCRHDGSLSGGTHEKADVFDLSYNDADKKAEALIDLGVIPFVRDPNWDGRGGAAHIHCIIVGSEHLSAQAAAQIPDWRNHKNGLASHAPYTGHPWKGDIRNFDYDPTWTRDGDKGDGQGDPHRPHFPDVEMSEAQIAALHAHHWHVREDVDDAAQEHPLIGPLAEAVTLLDQAGPLITQARQGLTHWRKQQGD